VSSPSRAPKARRPSVARRGRGMPLQMEGVLASAPNQPSSGDRIGLGATWAGRDPRRAVAGEAGDAVNPRGLNGLGEGHRRQDGGKSSASRGDSAPVARGPTDSTVWPERLPGLLLRHERRQGGRRRRHHPSASTYESRIQWFGKLHPGDTCPPTRTSSSRRCTAPPPHHRTFGSRKQSDGFRRGDPSYGLF
jgi:hypothetical protein